MRIFVTGATGFLGSYLVRELLDRGHDIGVLLRRNSHTWRIEDLLPQLEALTGSLDDVEELRSVLENFKPECILHLAWEGTGNSDRNRAIQARNIYRTVELAAIGADLGVKSFIGAGSQAEYGPYQRAIYETDATKPTTLYGKAKLAAGDMAADVLRQFGVRFAWLRVFSTYGPKDSEQWLIPSMIKSLREKRRVSLTLCEQLWGFLHAEDAASAFRAVAEEEAASGVYNLGSPDAPPLRETVNLLRDLIDPAAELGFGDLPYRPDQVMVLKANTDRLSALGWRPRVPLLLGLRNTVDWYNVLHCV
jgi:UDP-glucose 4-epimerase